MRKIGCILTGVPGNTSIFTWGEVCFRFNHRDQDLKPFLIKLLKATSMQDIKPKLVQIR